MSGLFNVAVIIVWLAIIATLVTHKGSSELVDAIGNTFSNSIKAAKS